MPKLAQKPNNIIEKKEKPPPVILGKYALRQLSLVSLETLALFIFQITARER